MHTHFFDDDSNGTLVWKVVFPTELINFLLLLRIKNVDFEKLSKQNLLSYQSKP